MARTAYDLPRWSITYTSGRGVRRTVTVAAKTRDEAESSVSGKVENVRQMDSGSL